MNKLESYNKVFLLLVSVAYVFGITYLANNIILAAVEQIAGLEFIYIIAILIGASVPVYFVTEACTVIALTPLAFVLKEHSYIRGTVSVLAFILLFRGCSMACDAIKDAHRMLYLYGFSFWFIMIIIMVLYTLLIYASVWAIYDGINSFSAISLISKKKTNNKNGNEVNTLYVKAVEKDGDGGAQTQNNTRRVEQAKILLPKGKEYEDGGHIVRVEDVYEYKDGGLRVAYGIYVTYKASAKFEDFVARFVPEEEFDAFIAKMRVEKKEEGTTTQDDGEIKSTNKEI